MYTIVLYSDENLCVDSYKDIIDPKAEGDNIYWQDGSLQGLTVNFMILEGDHEIEKEQDVSHLIDQDIKEFLVPFEQEQEKQTSDMQMMINAMLFDPKDSDQDAQINQMQSMINEMMLSEL
jgi:hypothetical protein